MSEHGRKTLTEDYACRIAWLRRRAGMTPAQFGELVGLDARGVEQFEQGELTPGLELLRRIATALGVNMSELFDVNAAAATPDDFRHALIVANVIRVLGNLVEMPLAVLPPMVALALPRPSGLTWPDVLVVREPPDEPSWLIRKPLVIVEVISAATETADRGDKFAACRTLDSLLDYILVATHEVSVEHYTRDEHEHDTWQLLSSGVGARVQLQAIHGLLAVDELYRGTTLVRTA